MLHNLRYNFGQFNEIMTNYMNSLIVESTKQFQRQINNREVSENDSYALAGGIDNVEEYLYYNLKKSPNNFHNILTSMINKAKIVAVLPKNERGIYGKAEAVNSIVYINPDLRGSANLTGEERTRLYMAHELGHMINNEWINEVEEFCNSCVSEGVLALEDADLTSDGFSLLDEATTQERAEEFAYKFSEKRRPGLEYYRNGRLFDGEPYKSNFDFYGELQEPAIMFARTLRGIGKEENDMVAISMLADRALSPKFFDRILREYTKDGQLRSFIEEVKDMGYIKRASYANFGYENAQYLDNSRRYLQNLKRVTSKMRDRREPFVDDKER